MKPRGFTGGHPDWNEGCWDHKLAAMEDKGTRELLLHHSLLSGVETVLDVGAGSGKHGRKIFFDKDLTCCDLNARAEDDVEKADVLDLPYEDGAFDLVHCRRVVSNLDTLEKRRRSLEELRRVARATVVLVDVWEPARRNLASELALSGVEALELPARDTGLGGLEADVFADLQPIHQGTLAAHFYVWSRLVIPLITGRHERYAPLRCVTPLLLPEDLERFGVHRLWVFAGGKL